MWTHEHKIICAQLRSVQMSATETIFYRLSAKWAQLSATNWEHSFHILRPVVLSVIERKWAQSSTRFHVKICAQLRSERKTGAKWAQTSANECKSLCNCFIEYRYISIIQCLLYITGIIEESLDTPICYHVSLVIHDVALVKLLLGQLQRAVLPHSHRASWWLEPFFEAC